MTRYLSLSRDLPSPAAPGDIQSDPQSPNESLGGPWPAKVLPKLPASQNSSRFFGRQTMFCPTKHRRTPENPTPPPSSMVRSPRDRPSVFFETALARSTLRPPSLHWSVTTVMFMCAMFQVFLCTVGRSSSRDWLSGLHVRMSGQPRKASLLAVAEC